MRVYYKQVQLNPTQETDYNDLANKPKINGVDLEGDLSTEQIKITWHGTQAEFDALPSVDPYTFYIIDDGIPVGMQESYLNLSDKPSINGQVLTGNKVSSDLNMYTSDEVDNIIASMRAIKVVTALPAAPAVNTMYYVGPDSEGVYMVYLFDSLLNRIDLGPSVQKLYTAGNAIGINETTSTISVKYDGTSIRTNTANELYVPELVGSEGSGVNPIYLANGELKASTSTVGHSIKPVYLDNGTIKEVTHVTSGQYERGVPYIAGSVMNTGNIIQMHQPTDSGTQWGNIALDATAGSVNLWNNNYDNKQKGAILTTNGDTMKNELYSSFPAASSGFTNKMVMNGAYAASSGDLLSLIDELRMSSGASGSTSLTSSYTDSGTGVTIPAYWYNYTWLPHRTGGKNGAASGGDNTLHGTLILVNFSNSGAVFSVGYHGSGAAAADSVSVHRLIYDDYINRFAPYCISDNGNAITSRTLTDYQGRTYSINSVANTGIRLSGTGVDEATVIHQTTNILQNGAGSCNLYFAYLYAGSTVIIRYDGWDAVNSVAIQGTKSATADSNGACNVSFFTANNSNGYDVDIRWSRTSSGDGWWRGSGTVTWNGNSSWININIAARGDTVSQLPVIYVNEAGTARFNNYSFEIFHKSF